MNRQAIFTIVLRPFDPKMPSDQRVSKILVGSQEISVQSLSLDFHADFISDALILRIPIRYVDILMAETEE